MRNIILILFAILISINSQAQTFDANWFDAFKNDDVAFVKGNVNEENIDACFSVKGNPYNLLSIAIKLEAKNIFNWLVVKKANLNLVCKAKTPAMYAVKYGQLDLLKTLIENNADLSIKNQGKTVMDYARNYNMVEIETYLASIKAK